MPALSKKQHEDFCSAYANRPCAGDAAHIAGFEFANRYQAGYRLLRRPEIVARIAELRTEVAERECLSEAALLTKLERTYEEALRNDQPLAAVRVIELQAKLGGLLAVRPAGAARARAAGNDPAGEAPVATVTANPGRFAPAPPQPDETARAALAAVARSRARKRATAA